jgi:hypothetical protein
MILVSEAATFREALRKLAMVDEGFVEAAAGLTIVAVLLAVAPVSGLSRVVRAALDVAAALECDIKAALAEPDD